ncbi:MAG: hypothetical protein R2747_22800 [Pyrinomonadaceae bacterium]
MLTILITGFTLNINAQLGNIADDTITYVKAGTFGKPDGRNSPPLTPDGPESAGKCQGSNPLWPTRRPPKSWKRRKKSK